MDRWTAICDLRQAANNTPVFRSQILTATARLEAELGEQAGRLAAMHAVAEENEGLRLKVDWAERNLKESRRAEESANLARALMESQVGALEQKNNNQYQWLDQIGKALGLERCPDAKDVERLVNERDTLKSKVSLLEYRNQNQAGAFRNLKDVLGISASDSLEEIHRQVQSLITANSTLMSKVGLLEAEKALVVDDRDNLIAERDDLRYRNKVQADNFGKLEQTLGAERGKLAEQATNLREQVARRNLDINALENRIVELEQELKANCQAGTLFQDIARELGRTTGTLNPFDLPKMVTEKIAEHRHRTDAYVARGRWLEDIGRALGGGAFHFSDLSGAAANLKAERDDLKRRLDETLAELPAVAWNDPAHSVPRADVAAMTEQLRACSMPIQEAFSSPPPNVVFTDCTFHAGNGESQAEESVKQKLERVMLALDAVAFDFDCAADAMKNRSLDRWDELAGIFRTIASDMGTAEPDDE